MPIRLFLPRSATVVLAGVLWSGASSALAETAFELGVEAFQSGRYDVAKARFTEARDAAPGDVLNQLWLGLATHATGGVFDGADQWRKATGHPRYESMAELFRGFSYWKVGYHRDAQQYFQETLYNNTDGKATDYPPGRVALADLAAGKAVPPLALWPGLAGLPTTPAGQANPPPAAPPPAPLPPPAAPPPGPPPPPVVPPPAPGQNPPAAPVPQVANYTPWEPFRTHAVGERVLFRVSEAEWRFGTILELGDRGAFLDKYLVRDERTGATSYHYHTDVAGLQRRDFWTGFFIGTWALGSGMAVNPRTEGGETRDEYLYVASSERLEIRADGSYTWTTIGGERIAGRWQAQPNNPGIVILRGDRDRDYLFYNITDPASIDVMREHHARLATPGIKTTLARRRIP
jgi:hypothetical protein